MGRLGRRLTAHPIPCKAHHKRQPHHHGKEPCQRLFTEQGALHTCCTASPSRIDRHSPNSARAISLRFFDRHPFWETRSLLFTGSMRRGYARCRAVGQRYFTNPPMPMSGALRFWSKRIYGGTAKSQRGGIAVHPSRRRYTKASGTGCGCLACNSTPSLSPFSAGSLDHIFSKATHLASPRACRAMVAKSGFASRTAFISAFARLTEIGSLSSALRAMLTIRRRYDITSDSCSSLLIHHPSLRGGRRGLSPLRI